MSQTSMPRRGSSQDHFLLVSKTLCVPFVCCATCYRPMRRASMPYAVSSPRERLAIVYTIAFLTPRIASHFLIGVPPVCRTPFLTGLYYKQPRPGNFPFPLLCCLT